MSVTAFLMAVIFTSVHTKGLKGLGWIASGAVVGIDILFFSFISGSAIDPMRYLAPAVLSGYVSDVWLYCTATFVGSAIVAMIYRKTIQSKSKMICPRSNLLSNMPNVNNKSPIDRIMPRDRSLR